VVITEEAVFSNRAWRTTERGGLRFAVDGKPQRWDDYDPAFCCR
jgi:hypothetical protein